MTGIDVTSTDSAAVARWAAAHARTARGTSAAKATPAAEHPRAGSRAAILTSFTEVRTIGDAGWTNAVGWVRHPDGRLLLATGNAARTIRIWDYGTGSVVSTLSASEVVIHLAWGCDADGQPLLAAQSRWSATDIWNPVTGERVASIALNHHDPPHDTPSGAIAWRPDPGGRLPLAISTVGDRSLQLWDPETGRVRLVRSGHQADVIAMAWGSDPDGRPLLATGDTRGTVRIWDPGTGQTVRTLGVHRGDVNAAAWGQRADGHPLLATADANGAVWVWDAADDQLVQAVTQDNRAVGSLAWGATDDGRLVLAGSSTDLTSSGTLYLWDGHPGDGRTLERLRTQSLDYPTAGFKHLAWTVSPAGELLLAVGAGHQADRVWKAVLDPPVPAPAAPRAAGQVARPEHRRAGGRPAVLDPPEEVTPDFEVKTGEGFRVACTAGDDGHVLLANATMSQTRGYVSHVTTTDGRHTSAGPEFTYWLVWDGTTGSLLHRLPGQSAGMSSLAWGRLPDGRPVLATADNDWLVRIWDPATGALLRQHRGIHDNGVNGIAWLRGQESQALVATGGQSDGMVRVWDPLTGEQVQALSGHGNWVNLMAPGRLASGQRCLVTGGKNAPARLWDADTGQLLRTLAGPPADPSLSKNQVWSGAWGHGPDGRPWLAIGTADGTVRIWDPETGHLLHTLTGHQGPVYSLAWAGHLGWPAVLVSASGGSYDGTARIWDAFTGTELAQLPSKESGTQALDLARSPDGDLLLVIATERSTKHDGPVRIWRIATADTAAGRERAPDGPGDAGMPGYQAAELAGWLLRLGNGGLWPPLGLVTDVVTLTGQVTDAGPAVLAEDAGIVRLRELGWAPAARVSFAALAASALTIPDACQPPPDAVPGPLKAALIRALADPVDRTGTADAPWGVPVADLRAATAGITDKTIALLAILGPEACAADPLLPARLAHHAAALPPLSPRQLRILAGAGSRRPATDRDTATDALVYTPDTADLARTGPLPRLLPTQLALPRDLMTMRLAESQLLYRQHRAPAPPSPDAVTIVLDTTPPTYGPAGIALRLAAHLLTVTLWEHGRHPALITLDAPDKVTELRAPADLITLWTAATLGSPLPALAAAMSTAAATGQPTLLATHHHTARAARGGAVGYALGPAARLLTTHQPPERPPRPPGARWHAHLPPSPTQPELTSAVARLIIPDTFIPDPVHGW
jgi:WD40 repeat protein